jgi:hypothetical protein
MLMIAFLTGVAFLGGRLSQTSSPAKDKADRVLVQNGGVVSAAQRRPIRRAAQLPAGSPEVNGILVRRKDDSLFVGSGPIHMTVDERGREIASHDGPVVEVLITHETQVYRDDVRARPESSSGPIQQVVRPGAADEIRAKQLISAWGEKRGDRLVADVVLYTSE